MRGLVFIGFGTLAAIVAWTALVFVGAIEGWSRQPLTNSDAPSAFMSAAQDIIDNENGGNIALLLIESGKVVDTHFQSTGDPADSNSLFQVASLSKWLSAWGVMTLVEDGKIDLDRPVSDYLVRWNLPSSPYDNDGVTVRRLLSHTAGLGDGLGYAGFETKKAVQSLEESLTLAQDASPGASGVVRVVSEPGEAWDYSGGGYTLLQLLVEEVSGQPFNDYMKSRVFLPLGMTQSTFDLDEAQAIGLASNYNLSGQPEALRYYTSLAATSLHTTANDLTLFVQAQVPQADKIGRGVLSPQTLNMMQVPHAAEMGADIWGLGVMLYAPNNKGDFIIGHDGNNEPAINTAVRFDPATGDGIIVLETGSPLLATKLAGEWIYWKTRNVDFLLFTMQLEKTMILAASGSGVILLIGLLIGWRRRRRSPG